MSTSKRTVLITGCSEGGLGSALAIAFHKAGLHVYATARNPDKMKHLVPLGIETMTLDVLSDTSIADCVGKLSNLDILVNNAGAAYSMPVADISIPEAKKLFDLNVWSYIAVTQAFLPLLVKSKGMIANHTSSGAVITLPFQSVYNASKAAMATFSDTQRLELQGFGITVVELRTGGVQSNILKNHDSKHPSLPKGSIYEPAKERVEKALNGVDVMEEAMPAEQWAGLVVGDLLKKTPPPIIWRGYKAWLVWISTFLPFGTFDATIKKMTGLDVVERKVKESQ